VSGLLWELVLISFCITPLLKPLPPRMTSSSAAAHASELHSIAVGRLPALSDGPKLGPVTTA
jgi:hypothetical protein